jgi:hypothetical protein
MHVEIQYHRSYYIFILSSINVCRNLIPSKLLRIYSIKYQCMSKFNTIEVITYLFYQVSMYVKILYHRSYYIFILSSINVCQNLIPSKLLHIYSIKYQCMSKFNTIEVSTYLFYQVSMYVII